MELNSSMTVQEITDTMLYLSNREYKTQNKETRTGIPREEYQEDEKYKAMVKSKREDYKNRSNSIQFVKPEPSMFTLSS